MRSRMYSTMSAVVLALAVSAAGGNGGAAQGEVLDAYVCRFAEKPIAVDGVLDDAAWSQAAEVPLRYPFDPKDKRVLVKGTARFMWDDKYVYVGFDFEDDDIWSFSDEPDSELWNGDVAEFFIKPRTDANHYFEFVVAPNATLFDGRYPSRGAGGYLRFKGWSSNAIVASRIDGTDGDHTDTDKGFTIEVAIPHEAFGNDVPEDGATWTFGAFRYNYSKSFEQPMMIMSVPEVPHNGYHCYESYEPLRFAK